MTAILLGGLSARTPRVAAKISDGTTYTLLFTMKLLTFEIIIFYPTCSANHRTRKFFQSRSERWNASRRTEWAVPLPRSEWRSRRGRHWENTTGRPRSAAASNRERRWDCKPSTDGRGH